MANLWRRLHLPNYLYMTMAYLENDFISPIIYTWQLLTKKTTSNYLQMTMAYTSLAQLFIHDNGLLIKWVH